MLQTAVLELTAPLVTGNQSFTGVGFPPTLVILIGNETTGDGSLAGSALTIGAFTASQRQTTGSAGLNGAVAGNDLWLKGSATRVYEMLSATGTFLFAAAFVSMDADGFTLNVETATTARKLTAVCLGGADLTNVRLGFTTAPAAPGTQATTGVGFQPDCVLIYGQGQTNAASVDFSSNLSAAWCAFTPTASRATGAREANNSYPTTSRGIQRTLAYASPSNTGFFTEATLVSMDADGFTLNFTTTPGAFGYFYIALKGIAASIIPFTSPASTGAVAYTGAGFPPALVFFSSACLPSATTNQAHCRRMLGVGKSATARAVSWYGSQDAVATTNTSQNRDTTRVVKHMVENGASPTIASAAALTSLDADGFTLDWDTADATARESWALCLGTPPPTGLTSGGPGSFIYRPALGRRYRGGLNAPPLAGHRR